MLINTQLASSSDIFYQLNQLKEASIIRALDYQFARFLYQLHSEPLIALVAAVVSYETSLGHTCFDLKMLKKNNLFNLPDAIHQQLINTITPSAEHWATLLQNSPVIGDGTKSTPLVHCQERLYLHRHWFYETTVIRWLQKQTYRACKEAASKKILHRLFPEGNKDNTTNWQKIAAALAASTTFTVISGGPGTGKTTTVTRLMALLVELSTKTDPPLSIELAAPTGKAAARLSESIRLACETLDCPSHIKRLIPKKAGTLHRLLGARPGSTHYRYNTDNPLHMDVLVVDEASMVDLTLMARLLLALPAHTKLILLGDRNQLSSVEAGSVLGDICAFADLPYTKKVLQHLEYVTGEKISTPPIATTPHLITLNNHLCLLRKSFRFKEDSGIGHLARAVNAGDNRTVTQVWEKEFHDIALHKESQSQSAQLVALAVKGYTPYLDAVAKGGNPQEVHALFNQFQILCALRSGPSGVEGLNTAIQKKLVHCDLLTPTENLWYPGRPVIITQNDHALELYNGDIGIALTDTDGKLRVAFIMPDNYIKMLLPNRLPEHETVFAMTIHKSQGSEFDHTVIMLPDSVSPLLTRELLYTGITRAKKQLDILGDPRLIQYAVKRRTQRVSGIVGRLQTSQSKRAL